MASTRIGLIGAGLMGHGLGLRLREAGHPLSIVANRNRVPVEDLVDKGAVECPNYATLAQTADIIILCVSNSDVVGAILHEIKPHLRSDQTIIDAGTSRPQDSVERAADLKNIGVSFSDCPLTGGPAQARAGTLGVLCGGPRDVIAIIKPVLQSFATTIRHMGEAGSGHQAKLISNFLVTGMIALVSESFAAAAKANIDPQALFDAMQNGSGNSGVLQKMVAPALTGDFNGYQFALANALKDIGYYVGAPDATALAQATHAFFVEANLSGDPNRNVSTLLTPSFIKSN